MATLENENPSEPVTEKFVPKTEEAEYRKRRYIYTDFERQLFNLDMSVPEFRRRAREMEKKSLWSRRHCRLLLRSRRHRDAWAVARKALESERNALLYNMASQRIKTLVRMVRSADVVDPLVKLVLKELDQSVQANDPERTKDLVNRLEEEYDLGFEEAVKFSEGMPTDDDIANFIVRLDEEIQILDRLKKENGSKGTSNEPKMSLCHMSSERQSGRSSESIHNCVSVMVRSKNDSSVQRRTSDIRREHNVHKKTVPLK